MIHVPNALRAAVNGLVIVGFAEAIILSSLLSLCGVPSAVLLGTTLAIVAFVPGAAPLLLAVVGVGLGVSGSTIAAVVVFVVGMLIVMFVDYTVRPVLIKGGTSLPFLAVLFGIFGGVIAMGVVGLVIGPVILVLLMVFFREATSNEAESIPEIAPASLARDANPHGTGVTGRGFSRPQRPAGPSAPRRSVPASSSRSRSRARSATRKSPASS